MSILSAPLPNNENTRNVKLLSEHYTQGKHRGSATPVIIGFLVSTLIILGLVAFISFKFLQWFFQYLDKVAPLNL